jgi:membrane fusion protein (multidrug efflux system)
MSRSLDKPAGPNETEPGDDSSGGFARADARREGAAPRQEPAETRGSVFTRPVFLIAIAVVLLLVVAAVLYWWLVARNYEDTDDAFIDTHIVRVSPQIAGRIRTVFVNDNQLVKAGDPLFDIDSQDVQSRLAQIDAQEAQARTQLGQAQAQIGVAEAAYQQALSATAAAQAQADNADQTLTRYHQLQAINPQAAAQQQVDQAQAAARSAHAQRDAAASQAKGASAQRGAAEAQVAGAQAQIKALQAQVEQARISVGYTRVTAPVAGHIAQRNAAPGNYISPGEQAMAIVPLQIWVTANFKETQLALMRLGQSVNITVDACPDAKIRGHVDSIQRGAGQAFGLLPPENATGNFVKVVQRVPVKIVLDSVPQNCPLGPGMSVEPTVKVR